MKEEKTGQTEGRQMEVEKDGREEERKERSKKTSLK